ncbi:MAG: YqaA family protein [Candidatus Brocadiia bacterium]
MVDGDNGRDTPKAEKAKAPSFLSRLYDLVISLAGKRYATWALAVISFVESSFFPIPPDALLMPMCFARPRRSFYYATICTIASVLGGMAGYALGLYFFGAVVHPTIEYIGWSGGWLGTPQDGMRVTADSVAQLVSRDFVSADQAASLQGFLSSISDQLTRYPLYTNGLFFKGILFFNAYGAMAVFIAAFSPIPYKVFTISAGFFGQPFPAFVGVSILGRGGRFFLVAGLIFFFGPRIEPWIRRNLEWLVIGFTVLLILGFLMLKLL